MASRFSHTLHPPIYHPGHPSLVSRALEGISHPFSMIADAFHPVRVCHRVGHVPGQDVYAYETWDLDIRHPGYYVGHACGRCGQLVG
ncbi:MAG: hypothetical protein ABI836_01420 [Gemmatimonadota bacterium]